MAYSHSLGHCVKFINEIKVRIWVSNICIINRKRKNLKPPCFNTIQNPEIGCQGSSRRIVSLRNMRISRTITISSTKVALLKQWHYFSTVTVVGQGRRVQHHCDDIKYSTKWREARERGTNSCICSSNEKQKLIIRGYENRHCINRKNRHLNFESCPTIYLLY